jgi:hypothetical protein
MSKVTTADMRGPKQQVDSEQHPVLPNAHLDRRLNCVIPGRPDRILSLFERSRLDEPAETAPVGHLPTATKWVSEPIDGSGLPPPGGPD